MIAIGIGEKISLYLIAYAIVKIVCTKIWEWFVEFLKKDKGIEAIYRWTIITDRQKGLVFVIINLLSDVEHKYCVRHMYKNFKVPHPILALKKKIWEYVRETIEAQFNSVMISLRSVNDETYKCVEKVLPKH